MEVSKFLHLSALIIDDDSFVRAMTSRIFKSIGVSRVLQASGGVEALALMESDGHDVNVVVCDLEMPEMDGVETLRHLPRVAPGAGIIIASISDRQITRMVEELAMARGLKMLGALPKPITPQSVSALLDKMASPPPRRGGAAPVAADRDRLLEALENGEIIPWFQPKVSFETGVLKGVEALVRWNHPERGILTPWFFLDAVENAGLADEFAEHMLRCAIKQAGCWNQMGLVISVAVNLSVSSLYRLDLPDLVRALMGEHHLSINQLTLEVTESGLMKDITTPFDVISRLAMNGIHLSIDDFGTGYSTIQQLVRLPFSEFKLDMSFVRGAQENERVRTVLACTVDMARKLNLSVVAEGIETRQNWDMLTMMRCDTAQGYFIGKPMPGEDIIDWNEDWKKRSSVLMGKGV